MFKVNPKGPSLTNRADLAFESGKDSHTIRANDINIPCDNGRLFEIHLFAFGKKGLHDFPCNLFGTEATHANGVSIRLEYGWNKHTAG